MPLPQGAGRTAQGEVDKRPRPLAFSVALTTTVMTRGEGLCGGSGGALFPLPGPLQVLGHICNMGTLIPPPEHHL